MKKHVLIIPLLLITLMLHAEDPAEAYDKNHIAETLGHLIVRHLANPGFELNLDHVIKGIQDERNGVDSPMSEEQYEKAIYAIQESMFAKVAEENLAQANDFLKENAAGKGIKALEPKLQYRVEKRGSGEALVEESAPLIHYKGTLLDGTVFANSQEAGGEPIVLPINQTIPGFTKGLVGMKEGEKRTLYIHPDLAYGVSGHLPPNSLLIFEVEILKAHGVEEEAIAAEGSSTEESVR